MTHRTMIIAAAIVCFLVVLVATVIEFGSRPRTAAFSECSTLGGTLIISADERYICVPDAVEVGE